MVVYGRVFLPSYSNDMHPFVIMSLKIAVCRILSVMMVKRRRLVGAHVPVDAHMLNRETTRDLGLGRLQGPPVHLTHRDPTCV